MRVLVTGGRDYSDRDAIFSELDALHAKEPGITLLVNGGASGADKWARDWAEARRVACDTYPADWKRWGRSAGPRRNQFMLIAGKPDLVLAFPGGDGTQDMVRRALSAGVQVQRYEPHRENRA